MLTHKQERLLLFLLVAIQFSNIVDFMIMMPLGPQLMRVFSINPHQFSLLVSAYTFAASFSGFFAAFFIDRFDRKAALLFFYLGFGIGTVSCALAPSYEALLFARAATGIFGGVLGALVTTIVGDAIPMERRGAAMGIVMTAFSAAAVFGVPLGLFLANSYGWHFPFLFLGAVSIILWTTAFKLAPKMRKHLEHQTRTISPFTVIANVLKNKNQVYALLLMSLLVLGQFTVIPFLSPSMVSNAGMAEKQLPLIYFIGGGLTIFTGPIIGRLSDIYGKKNVGTVAIIISLVPIFLITRLSVTPIYMILILTSLFFICISGRMPPVMAVVTGTAHPEKRGSFMSFVGSIMQLSSATASYVAGSIIEKNSLGQLTHFEKVGYIAIFFSIVAGILLHKIKPLEGDPHPVHLH